MNISTESMRQFCDVNESVLHNTCRDAAAMCDE